MDIERIKVLVCRKCSSSKHEQQGFIGVSTLLPISGLGFRFGVSSLLSAMGSRQFIADLRITNAPLSSSFIIYAKTDTKGPASKGITAFLVERKWKGFEVGESLDKFGVSSNKPSNVPFRQV